MSSLPFQEFSRTRRFPPLQVLSYRPVPTRRSLRSNRLSRLRRSAPPHSGFPSRAKPTRQGDMPHAVLQDRSEPGPQTSSRCGPGTGRSLDVPANALRSRPSSHSATRSRYRRHAFSARPTASRSPLRGGSIHLSPPRHAFGCPSVSWTHLGCRKTPASSGVFIVSVPMPLLLALQWLTPRRSLPDSAFSGPPVMDSPDGPPFFMSGLGGIPAWSGRRCVRADEQWSRGKRTERISCTAPAQPVSIRS